MQLRVVKCDGTIELYLHNKVMASLAAALAEVQSKEITEIDALAEPVTTYLKKRYGSGRVDSDEIHAVLLAVLAEVGCDKAALGLHEHRVNRQLKRNRIEVISNLGEPTPWNKSIIVRDLEGRLQLNHDLARCVASSVEERILNLGYRQITTTLIDAMVQNELVIMQKAEKALSLSEQTQWVERQLEAEQPLMEMV